MDLAHGQALVGRTDVRAGAYEDLSRAHVVVVAAGVNQRPGESRIKLLERNLDVFADIASALDRHAPSSVLLVATNPVDILTHALQELSSRPHSSIVGTGTLLDTARLRAALGRRYEVSPKSVHAQILGEHGDSAVPVWSSAAIGGLLLRERTVLGKTLDEDARRALFDEARGAAAEIIERKGYTSLGIGIVIARLVERILSDQRTVVPVSVRAHGEYELGDVCLSLPAVVGASGAESTIPPELDDDELSALRRSAAALTENRRGVVLRPACTRR
jgi:L-lactate dehydrogenase